MSLTDFTPRCPDCLSWNCGCGTAPETVTDGSVRRASPLSRPHPARQGGHYSVHDYPIERAVSEEMETARETCGNKPMSPRETQALSEECRLAGDVWHAQYHGVYAQYDRNMRACGATPIGLSWPVVEALEAGKAAAVLERNTALRALEMALQTYQEGG